MSCKSPYKYKSLALTSNLFQLEIEVLCEKRFGTHLNQVSKDDANKK